jgi:UDP-N-acetylglucosamine 1-carboxyvinyltransferase
MLRILNLKKAFGGHDVLQGVTLEIGDREKVALVGPNGAGKSTLLKIVAGLLAADDGTVKIQGEAARETSYLPQDAGIRNGRALWDEMLSAFPELQRVQAELAVADERSVVKVDAGAPLETIAPLGCGVQTGVGAVWNVLQPRPGDAVVVLGVGAVGLSAVMAAALTPGETVIGNAACEPHVQDLCRFLVSLGAEIQGIESNVLRIRGVDRLRGGDWRIAPEHIEVGSFVGLAAVTGSNLTIEDVEPRDLVSIVPAFARLGIRVELDGSTLRVPPVQELVIQNDLGDQIPKIEDGPWPAFPADLTSIVVAVATQARGTVLVFEKMFENRLFFVDKLVSMGARIIVCDPHRVVVTGPARLYGQRMASPDIRAGMAMLIAALCAEGTSTIGNIAEIDRGYERIDERLRALGAHIERVEA